MIFIYMCMGMTNRRINERWQHSGETIFRVLRDVRLALLLCSDALIVGPKAGDQVDPYILHNPKFYPYFRDCIGAIDGSHIPAVVKLSEQPVYRNRKKFISQNILAAVNFAMVCIYLLVGWEGSAHDGKVLADATTKGFPWVPGKYYLGDVV